MKRSVLVVAAIFAIGCASLAETDTSQDALNLMKSSFNARGQAGLDRLEQDETQRLCSRSSSAQLTADETAKIEAMNRATLKYPADGKFIGNWRNGEKIAQSGVGKQYSDDPKQPSGGNCYACHQLTKEEIAFGTMGPGLYNYGRRRGADEAAQRYTYGKIWNSQAFSACSNMPRFGHSGILTEQQIKDVTALLLDPDSPVNK